MLSKQVTVYPVIDLSFDLSETAHNDTIVNVIPETSELNGLNVEWLLENGFGFQDFGTYVSGTLDNSGGAEPYSIYASDTLTKAGGSLTFPTKGQYTLFLTMIDPTGRSFTNSRSFTVFPIPTMGISILPLAYSGDSFAVTTSGSEHDGTDTAWLISMDGGQSKPYTQYATGIVGTGDGSLTISTDKTITVKLIGETTDVNGRKFTFTSNTATIKPIASFPFTIPSSVHIGSNINVSLPTVSGLEGRVFTYSQSITITNTAQEAAQTAAAQAVPMKVAVVIGAFLLGGLYALFGETILPILKQRIMDMFNYGG